jgi:hypothetical protein
MKTYKSFEEISRDLKLLSLERQIALEELKMVKNDFEESLKPLSMVKNIFTAFGKFGVLMLIKRVFK